MSETREKHVFELEVGGRTFRIEYGHVAEQANAAVLARYGDTVVLVTATATKEPREGVDFFPLRVDYEERQYAAGRIPGSFFRREGRPSERAILSARLIDRPIRPLFPKGFRNDVQVVATVLSYDGENAPDVTSIVGASAALTISDIPFAGPIGAVLVGLVDGRFVVNPYGEALAKSDLELVVAGTKDAVLMVEAGANEVPEEKIVEAIQFGHDEIRRQVAWQEEIRAQVGKPKMAFTPPAVDPEVREAVFAWAGDRVRAALRTQDKKEREERLLALRAEAQEAFSERFPEKAADVALAFDEAERQAMRRMILDEGVRPDGRGPEDIRPVWCEAGILPRTHGSGLFTRGQTQILTVVALGAVSDRQILDSLGDEEFKRYMHHYNMPPYSTGEVRPMRSPGRREIGHGALAERALVRMVPPEEEFPYTIRVVSEAISSNGSTSMGSVCGSTLALMDAGVPLRRPVSGIAMGLIKEGDEVAILSDIQGIEDHLGDMDFKVAGTERGVTAIQMDIKIQGLDVDTLRRALEQARRGRMHILAKMLEAIPEPRREISPYAPRILVLRVNPERIRDVIGPGGKTVNRIVAETGAQVDIEDDGRVFITGPAEGCRRAQEMILQLTKEVVPGEIYLGKVTRLVSFGAFCEILPGREGLVHISQLADERVPTVEDVVAIGDIILVKVTEIDSLGRINLSRKQALHEVPNAESQESRQKAKVRV
ncbi:MAG: polyribonucleotide nucleotidyltransferase [Clostridia bacterium]|nr:polyribonucleotide nucleotidyltransferase [Clostridia bacterium]